MYEWNFCTNDFGNDIFSQDKFSTSGYNLPLGLRLVQDTDSIWYAFIVNRTNNRLFRINLGTNINSNINVSQFSDLGNVGNAISESEDIAIVKEGNKWYGLVLNRNPAKLVLLEFGNTLANTPKLVKEYNTYGKLDFPRRLESVSNSDKTIIAISNYNGNSITFIDFSGGLEKTLSETDVFMTSAIPNISRPMGLSVIGDCGEWYVFVNSQTNRKIVRLFFDDNLFQNPLSSEVLYTDTDSRSFVNIKYINEGNNHFLLASSIQSGIVKLKSESGLNGVFSPSASPLVGSNTFSNNFGIDFIQDSSRLYGYRIDYNSGKLFQLSFDDTCNVSYTVSSAREPKDIYYTKSGTYHIGLKAIDSNGNSSYSYEEISVNSSESPRIDIKSQNRCLSTVISFDGNPSEDSNVTSYQWNFGDSSPPASGQQVTHQYTTPGTYEVTLEVESANGCGNRLTKEITIYEPPVPNFTTPTGQICTNGVVNFTNTTNTQGADSLITYQWFVDDELVSEEVNPAITFAEGGAQTVRLEAGIPGCTETTEQTLNVLQGPTVRFNVAQICQGNPIVFENLTTGEGITGYAWDFAGPDGRDGGSFSSVTPENPTYVFAEAGTYIVALTVTNTLGCQNVYRQEVTVYEQPRVGFLSEVACVGTPTQFTDTTTAGPNANVIAWQWDFGDDRGTAAVRNPTYAYPQPGTYQVKLVTQTTAGCTDSAFQTVTVESPVATGFTATQQCATNNAPYTVLLTDASVVAEGDALDRWFWTVNGENFVSSEVTYAFPAPGSYPVSLTAFAASGCNATVTHTVRVDSLLQLSFTAAQGCTGEPLKFQPEIVAPGQEITRYAWDFDGVGTAFEANPSVTFAEAGTYAVTLTVQTADECTYTTTQPVMVVAAPVAAFTASPDLGGTPLDVAFENTTTDATQYAWDFAGLGTSAEENPTFTFTDVGTYRVTLTATNGAGCTSVAQQTVEVVVPVQDLRLDEITVSENTTGDAQQILLSVTNQGSLVASGITITVNLDEAVTVQEQLTQPVLPGETVVYPLRFQLPVAQRNQRNPLRYLCVSLAANEANVVEEHPEDNRQCVSLNQQLNVEPPFPNPASDELRISVILPASDAVALRLMNQEGKVLRQYRREAAPAGLNTFVLNVQGMPVGAYVLQITYQGEQRQFRVAVGG